MAKKKRRTAGPAAAGTGSAVAGEPAAGAALGEELLASAVRAAQWLAGKGAAPGHELLESVKPVILLRAAKYQLDAGTKEKPKPGPKVRSLGAAPGALALSPEEVRRATEAFKALAKQPEELLGASCKSLRTALHPLVEATLREEKASPAFRITAMLGEKARWPEALRLLRELRALEASRRPKLGAYQRWVRELDVAEGSPQEFLMLDAIMRLAAGFGPDSSVDLEGHLDSIQPWRPVLEDLEPKPEAQPAKEPADGSERKSTANQLFALIAERKAAAGAAATPSALAGWRVLAHEKAAERMPPNHYDLDIYFCPPAVLSLAVRPQRLTARHAVPGVEGAFVLSDVLSVEECLELREATEKMGYRPDVPLSSQLDERAHNVVLMANEVQNASLFERIKHLLPAEIAGEKLLGINRRWRFYRYLSGNLYRKHLDGAWPASGISTENGKEHYVYDAYGGGTRSKLTFIIYLNDDFEGGCTTFFTPKPGKEGTLDSRPVRPRVGSASVFPHGDCRIPLLHEGSAVTKGTKYLLRTDVVYARPETSEDLKHQARLRGLARQLGGRLGGNGLLEEQQADKKSTNLDGDVAPGKAKPGKAKRGKPGKKSVLKSNLKGKDGKEAEAKKPSKGKDRTYGKKAKKRGSMARRR